MTRSPLLINRPRAAVMVIDVQERLLPAMCDQETLLLNVVLLLKGAVFLKIPILATEQYRKGLGATLSEVAAAIPEFSPIEKQTFSACRTPGLIEDLHSRGVLDVLLCGIEAHVCVSQTCLDLLSAGFRVFVCRDAVSSRTAANHQAGLERMRAAGALAVSTELALFELLERAGTAEFKEILKLVK